MYVKHHNNNNIMITIGNTTTVHKNSMQCWLNITITLMVMCDFCGKFYHMECVGITQEEAHNLGSYKCSSCVDEGCDDLLYDGWDVHN